MLEMLPGKYVIAVSGGVDSIALLHMLHGAKKYHITVAHLDHAVREDSDLDRQLVQAAAAKLNLPFVTKRLQNPPHDEAGLRAARYKFLRQVVKDSGGQAIITAHHQDDVIETMLLHLMRGTNRHGLSPMTRTPDIIRPLLDYRKADLYAYARANQLDWREDSTNQDISYRRNYVRHRLLPKLSAKQQQQLLTIYKTMTGVNNELDRLLAELIDDELSHRLFASYDHLTSRAVLAAWLRYHGLDGFTSRQIDQLVIAAKTLEPNKQVDVLDGRKLVIKKCSLALKPLERYNKETHG